MKRVYQITPVSLYDVRGVESWLEDMALRGLALKRIRPLFSTFEEGPARKTRYRAEPYHQKAHEDLPRAMLDLYQDFGWTLVCAANDFLIFSTQDPDAPEPHSDPELQSQLWKKLYRTKRRSFFWSLTFLIFFAVMSAVLLWQNPLVLALVTDLTPTAVICLPFFIVESFQDWGDLQRLSLVVRQLEAGVPLDHRIAYPRRRWGEAAAFTAAVVLLVLLIFSQFILPLTGIGIRPLEELTAFPPLTLAQVEGEGYEPRRVQMNGRDYGNFCDVDHYLLCPDRWEVVQSGSITPEEWVRMEIWWYDLPGWLSFLSVPLAQELLDDAMKLDGDIWWTDEARVWTVHYYPREDAALLVTASTGPQGFQIAAAACGDKAVLVQYTGHGDLADHLEEIVTMVTGEEAV